MPVALEVKCLTADGEIVRLAVAEFVERANKGEVSPIGDAGREALRRAVVDVAVGRTKAAASKKDVDTPKRRKAAPRKKKSSVKKKAE